MASFCALREPRATLSISRGDQEDRPKGPGSDGAKMPHSRTEEGSSARGCDFKNCKRSAEKRSAALHDVVENKSA